MNWTNLGKRRGLSLEKRTCHYSVAVAVALVSILALPNAALAAPASPPATASAVAQPPSYKELLSQAREQFAKPCLTCATYLLQQIPATAPEHAEAKKLQVQIDIKEKAGAKKIAAANLIRDKATRVALANELEQAYLNSGMDTHVTVGGRQNERLNIRYVFCSRVFMHRLDESALRTKLVGAGFTSIHCNNGHGETWWNDYKS